VLFADTFAIPASGVVAVREYGSSPRRRPRSVSTKIAALLALVFSVGAPLDDERAHHQEVGTADFAGCYQERHIGCADEERDQGRGHSTYARHHEAKRNARAEGEADAGCRRRWDECPGVRADEKTAYKERGGEGRTCALRRPKQLLVSESGWRDERRACDRHSDNGAER
jgi:hypothetical protein